MNAVVEEQPLLKLNLGSGPSKMEGYLSVDSVAFPNVDHVVNLAERCALSPEARAERDGFRSGKIAGEPAHSWNESGFKRWPWPDNSVSDIHMSHVLEHFTGLERVHIANEMYRVLVNQGKATVITPHWGSNRAYGDFTHEWPPVSEMYLCYLSKAWRKANAPHTDIEFNPRGHNCDFQAQGVHTYETGRYPGRNQEFVQFALSNYRDAVMDFHATWIALKG
jgi:hypothetical protein